LQELNTKNKVIEVVGGLIIQKDKLLIAQRTKNTDHPLKWEFPGGKIKQNESPKDALKRELKEELNIKINSFEFLIDYFYEYKISLKKIHLFFYIINSFQGLMQKNVHQNLKWIEIKDISHYDFLDGDRELINRIKNNEFKIY